VADSEEIVAEKRYAQRLAASKVWARTSCVAPFNFNLVLSALRHHKFGQSRAKVLQSLFGKVLGALLGLGSSFCRNWHHGDNRAQRLAASQGGAVALNRLHFLFMCSNALRHLKV